MNVESYLRSSIYDCTGADINKDIYKGLEHADKHYMHQAIHVENRKK